jgi:hypothetical protein
VEATSPPDSIHTAPGWRVLGEKPHFSCVYPPGRQPAPEVVAAIREICPDIIPVWMSEVYLPPDSATPVLCGWHVLARHSWNPKGPHAQFGTLMPPDWSGPAPNLMEIPIQGSPGPNGEPPPYEPLDWRTVAMLRKRYAAKSSTELIMKVLEENKARRARAQRHLMQEEMYQRRDVQRWIRKRMALWDASDWRQLYAQGKETRPHAH